jgi:hypothetical protein
MSHEVVYVLGDGDRTRTRIEVLLFDAKLDQLALVSSQISEAIVALSRHVSYNIPGSRVIVAGGDDILFTMPRLHYQEVQVQELAAMYAERTGGSICFGVAMSIEYAYLALRKAKAHGTGIIINNIGAL